MRTNSYCGVVLSSRLRAGKAVLFRVSPGTASKSSGTIGIAALSDSEDIYPDHAGLEPASMEGLTMKKSFALLLSVGLITVSLGACGSAENRRIAEREKRAEEQVDKQKEAVDKSTEAKKDNLEAKEESKKKALESEKKALDNEKKALEKKTDAAKKNLDESAKNQKEKLDNKLDNMTDSADGKKDGK